MPRETAHGGSSIADSVPELPLSPARSDWRRTPEGHHSLNLYTLVPGHQTWSGHPRPIFPEGDPHIPIHIPRGMHISLILPSVSRRGIVVAPPLHCRAPDICRGVCSRDFSGGRVPRTREARRLSLLGSDVGPPNILSHPGIASLYARSSPPPATREPARSLGLGISHIGLRRPIFHKP